MRTLIIAFLLALLAGCAQAPSTPIQAVGQARVTGFGTLSSWGDWEFDLAPTYTAGAVVLHQADARVKSGRISIATAKAIKAKVDRAHQLLDASRRGNAKNPTNEQRLQLLEARLLISEAEKLLEVRP